MRPGCIRCATLRGVVDGSPSVTTLCGGFALALVPITHVSDQGYGIAPSVGTRRGFLMPRLCVLNARTTQPGPLLRAQEDGAGVVGQQGAPVHLRLGRRVQQ